MAENHSIPELTAARLRELFNYDPETGLFTRIARTANSTHIGEIAGSLSVRGYIHISIKDVLYRAHRLVWLYVHGEWPKSQIDHINMVRHDNRLANLRECSQSENLQNRRKQANNTTGFVGVSFDKESGRFIATIAINRRKINLGRFATAELAHNAYAAAKPVLHTFHPITPS